jgi:prolyl-tRNA editing enzyme YbaK/EbsC (Cys-tRNA(Pro) deacylase)
VSLVNTELRSIVDDRVMEVETVYGETGGPNHTLRISPHVVVILTQAQVFGFMEPKDKVES